MFSEIGMREDGGWQMAFAKELTLPINTVAVGDAADQPDLAIQHIEAPPFAFTRSETHITVTVSSVGLKEREVEAFLKQDGMVLQRESAVPVWGWADEGDEIRILFHGQSRRTRPDAQGKWIVYFPAMEAGGPFEMLKLRQTTNKLCLFCHDGSDPNAPDVLGPVIMYAGTGDEHSGAGFFGSREPCR